MAKYRSILPNYYSDKGGSYVSIGAIVPVLTDTNSDPTNDLPTEDPHYSHRGYLYCDGSKFKIRDYPLLYDSVRNEYLQTSGPNGNEKIAANAILSSVSGAPGTVHRVFVDNNKVYVEIYGKEYTAKDGSTAYDRVVPNNATLSFQELNDFPGAKTWRRAVTPYNALWSTFMRNYSVYPSINDPLADITHTYTGGTVTIPSDGNYRIQWATDNTGTIQFNGSNYGNVSSFREGDDVIVNLGNLTSGDYPISFSINNGASGDGSWAENPGGIAIRLYRNSDNLTVWNTRDNVSNTTGTGIVEEKKEYRLNYAEFYQSLASRSDVHVYRVLVGYDPGDTSTGTPGATVTWNLTSGSLLATSGDYDSLPIANYGTVPVIDPGTYDPITGGGYPTGYTQYPGARNDTLSVNWGSLFGLPTGVTVDTYELYIENRSTDTFVQWHVKNIPNSVTSFSTNQPLPTGATIIPNSVATSSIGSSPDWVNNGYSGPQPPDGKKHKFRINVIANLTNSQTLITHLDFVAGSGTAVPDFGSPTYTDNYDITGTAGSTPPTGLTNIVIGSLSTQPLIRIRKGFDMSDYPYILGEFRVPDYRDRKLIGYGEGVEGAGTPLVGDRITMKVGDIGGQWYIPVETLESPEFYEISDVVTTGYSDVTADISPFITGEKKYVVGPTEDYIFSRPATHSHNVLGSEVYERSEASMGGTDEYTTEWINFNGAMLDFVPGGPSGDGEALGHSHGLLGERPNNTIATYGNVEGVGESKPSNALPDKTFAVDDPGFIDKTTDYNDSWLVEWGTGVGELGGFVNPGLEQTKYLRMSSLGTDPQATLAEDRGVTFNIDMANYTKFYVLAIVGNDHNGGERPNQAGEGLRIIWPNGSEETLLPSKGDTSLSFDEYDAAYSYWKRQVVNIPTEYQTNNVEITLKQDLSAATTYNEYRKSTRESLGDDSDDGSGVGALHPNGLDSVGIAQVGLMGGTAPDVEWDGCYNYKITNPPTVPIADVVSDGTYLTVTTSQEHGFEVGDTITIGATGDYDGTFEIETDLGFSSNTFKVQPQPAPSVGSYSGGTVREAGGYFTDVAYDQPPKVWVVDQQTTIGGKEIKASDAPIGNVIYDQTRTDANSSLSVPANPGGSTNISGYSVSLAAPGGGGGGSTGNGGNGGSASATLVVDGITHTITVTGGTGGGSGAGGGTAGQGGTVSIPAVLINDPRFTFDTQVDGNDGSTGAAGGAGGTGDMVNNGGNGGDEDTTTSASVNRYFSSSGSFNATGVVPSGGTVSSVQFDISGAAGGNGPGNGQAGCSTTGGTRSNGRRLYGTASATSFTFIVGSQGSTGQNIHGGSTVESTTSGGSGAANGGTGGRGAWGNGGSGGGGGGATSLSAGIGLIAGAGGGGGGGGNGGGNNGGSVTDPCWTGGSGLGPAQGTYSSSAIYSSNGGNGGTAGCTAGGGGGGGGGFGPAGGGSGGAGGVAGAGHVNTGSGSGGRAGRSAYNTTYTSGVSESSGSSGGGYVSFTVNYTLPVDGPDGGGGGGGAVVSFSYIPDEGTSTAIACTLGAPGTAGSGGGNVGSKGQISVQVYEEIPGDDSIIGITSPAGLVYEVPGYPDSPTWPSNGSNIGGGVWHSSSDGVRVNAATGANFPIDTVNTGGKSNRYIIFSGAGSRFLQIGPLNLRNANGITFSVIKGNNSNGGDSPEEGLFAYYKTSVEATSETLLAMVAGPTSSASGYTNYKIDLDENNSARADGIYIVLRQNRPEGSGDNDAAGTGNTNDNWALSQFALTYDTAFESVFTPSVDATLPSNTGECGPDVGIDVIRRTVTARDTNIRFTDGRFQLSASTPLSVTAQSRVQETIPLITRYHRSKYLIKAF